MPRLWIERHAVGARPGLDLTEQALAGVPHQVGALGVPLPNRSRVARAGASQLPLREPGAREVQVRHCGGHRIVRGIGREPDDVGIRRRATDQNASDRNGRRHGLVGDHEMFERRVANVDCVCERGPSRRGCIDSIERSVVQAVTRLQATLRTCACRPAI